MKKSGGIDNRLPLVSADYLALLASLSDDVAVMMVTCDYGEGAREFLIFPIGNSTKESEAVKMSTDRMDTGLQCQNKGLVLLFF